ncbi:MAG: FAD/NAD(P)-binding protein [Candidatus Paceibacterota bacterium]
MKNLYQPETVKIEKIEALSPGVKLLRLKKRLNFVPGQFVLAGLWGWGEAPFGVASSPYQKRHFDLMVRKVGTVSAALHSLERGDKITIRGPYGNGFPLDSFKGKDAVMISGGCGIPPIASLIEYFIKNRKKFGRLYLLYGAATPDEILIKNKINEWQKAVKILLTVDRPTPGWKGHSGLVTELIKEIEINPSDAVAAMCGPGPMTAAVEKILKPLGIPDRRIFVNEERKMHCGLGKCQHCTTGDKYVCLDGPVFNYDQIDKNTD